MHRTWTAQKCLERACRLMLLADEAKDYQQILIYDRLAQEWLALAARASRERSTDAAQDALSRRQRLNWRDFRAWFR